MMERSASTSCPNHLCPVGDSLEVACYRVCTTEGLNLKKGIGDRVTLLVGVGWSTDLGPPPFPEFTKLDLCETLKPLGLGCILELCAQNVTTSHVYQFKFKSIKYSVPTLHEKANGDDNVSSHHARLMRTGRSEVHVCLVSRASQCGFLLKQNGDKRLEKCPRQEATSFLSRE